MFKTKDFTYHNLKAVNNKKHFVSLKGNKDSSVQDEQISLTEMVFLTLWSIESQPNPQFLGHLKYLNFVTVIASIKVGLSHLRKFLPN